jgi:hypothetical protein
MTKNSLRLHVVMQPPVMEYAEQSKDKDAYMMSCCEYVEKQEVLMTKLLGL